MKFPLGRCCWRRAAPGLGTLERAREFASHRPGAGRVARVAALAFDLYPARTTVRPLGALDLPQLRAAMLAADTELTAAGAPGGRLAAESLAILLAVHYLTGATGAADATAALRQRAADAAAHGQPGAPRAGIAAGPLRLTVPSGGRGAGSSVCGHFAKAHHRLL
jgi:hypothetical protein